MFFKWWYKRLRNIDKRILWPAICEACVNEEQARHAFFIHTRIDPAWDCLSVVEFYKEIGELKYVKP